MKKLVLVALSALSIGALAGCNAQDTSPNYKSGDKIYTSRIIFDSSEENPENVHFDLGDVGGVKEVKYGRTTIKHGFHNGVLTLDGADLKTLGAREADITVTLSNGRAVKVPALLATKIIKTVDDYKHINDSGVTLQGIYILGNDIDFSNEANVEPLGWYYDETDPTNAYFHGILDGDGYSLKNMKVSYSDSPVKFSDSSYQYPSNFDVYSGAPKFTNEAHQAGDNIGVFQFIGSSGIVRNLTFDNVKVHGRTIVGIIAGNNSGLIENCLIKPNCEVKMDTHFWSDDCNCGAIAGIVGGKVLNTVSLTQQVSVLPAYQDYGDKYTLEPGTGYDHGGSASNNFWRFWGANKKFEGELVVDSNGSYTNGVYSGVGKSWGEVKNSIGAKFIAERAESSDNLTVQFGQTHQKKYATDENNKAADKGLIENCAVYTVNELKTASNYAAFDSSIWDIVDGQFPAIKANVNSFRIAE